MASLQAQDICSLARQISKAPAGYTVQSGQFLNLTLRELLTNRDLTVNLLTENVTIPANTNGPFNGAANYLRTYNFTYTINGIPFKMSPISLDDFDVLIKSPQIANYPDRYSVDVSPQATGLPLAFYIYPQSNQTLTVQHRYYGKQADIASPETSTTTPWFIDEEYLIPRTAAWLMTITDDSRYDDFVRKSDEMLKKYLMTEGDREFLTARVMLDPIMYRRSRSLRPTKITG